MLLPSIVSLSIGEGWYKYFSLRPYVGGAAPSVTGYTSAKLLRATREDYLLDFESDETGKEKKPDAYFGGHIPVDIRPADACPMRYR